MQTTVTTWHAKEEAIRKLERKGRIDPTELIEAARDPSHPCHNDFTWDVEEAARERWHDQARALIRKCKFEVIYAEATVPVVRYIASIDGGSFLALPRVREADTDSVLLRELRMLSGLASRVFGIAAAKEHPAASALQAIRDRIVALKEGLETE